MQLGFVTAILPDQTLAEVAALAQQQGYQCLEVMCWPVGRAERRYAGVTHIDVDRLDDAAVDEVKTILAKHGVSISALGYYPNPLSPDHAEADTSVAHLRKVMQAAVRLGIDRVNTFVGRDWHASVNANWPRFLATWRPLIAEASALGLRIGIENCPMLFSEDEWPGGKNLAVSPEIWRRMFSDIPDPCFGLNYDPSHLVWQHMDYLAPLYEFANRIHHVHAKDVCIDAKRLAEVGILATPLSYHQPVLPGRGAIDWAQFFHELKASGYQGPVCVEVEDRAFEGDLASRQEALRLTHVHLAPLLAAVGSSQKAHR
jgi:sugar phosphate isomerase/epimerase